MTVSTTTNKVSYTGNGVTTTFAYGFKIYADSDLKVYVAGTLKTLTTHYTVTNAGVDSGGNVIFTSGNIPASAEKVVIQRALAKTQSTDWNNYDKYTSETLEDSVDRLTFISQELGEVDDRTIKLSTTVTDLGTVEISATSAERANKVFAFDGSGNLSIATEIGTFKGNWAASTGYVVRDLIKDTNNSNIYLCNTAHTSSGAVPISSNTDVAKWDLIVDAAAAATSATNAAASASTASSHKTDAETAKTAAETAKTAAETAQAASETAKTASETAKTASEAALDDFTDIFLGSKSSDPTVDNDGDALATGALYFNTTNNVMMTYTGSAWVRTTPTSTDQGHINTVSGISANVTTVAGNSANVTTVAGNNSNINTVAAANTNVTNVGGSIANVNTVASNISDVNNFSDQYKIATSEPGSPSAGDLWYDSSSTNQLKYYNGTTWIGIAPGITSETDPSAIAMAIAL